MAVSVKIPVVFRSHVGGERSVEAEAGTLAGVLSELGDRFPSLGEQILSESGLHRFVNVYVNDEDVRYLEGLETAVNDGDVVSILPAVAGG